MPKVTIERHWNEDCLIPALKAIGQSHRVTATEDLPPHREDFFEIHLVTNGSVNWWVENEVFNVPPDSVFFTKPNELHGGVHNIMQPCSLLWLQVDAEKLNDEELVQELMAVEQHVWLGASQLTPYLLPILNECRFPHTDSQRMIDAQLRLFMAQFLRHARAGNHQRSYPEKLDALLGYIDNHLTTGITTEELCDYGNLSRSRVFQLFEQYIGQSPIAYIMTKRIELAKQMLAESADTITNIALDLGFSSSQHFATAFKRIEGISPRDYRSAVE